LLVTGDGHGWAGEWDVMIMQHGPLSQQDFCVLFFYFSFQRRKQSVDPGKIVT
jgi:hypothetical protein